MKKSIYIILAVWLLALPLSAQANEIILANLSDKFGQISHRDLETHQEFVFSAEFADIGHALNLANSNDMYVQSASISARDDGKAAIILKISPVRNDASRHFATLSNILRPGMFSWKSGKVPENMAVLTTIETHFDNTVSLQGLTLKSGLIFSHLFPLIERTGELREPFFSRGSYSDSKAGRLMNFTVVCKW